MARTGTIGSKFCTWRDVYKRQILFWTSLKKSFIMEIPGVVIAKVYAEEREKMRCREKRNMRAFSNFIFSQNFHDRAGDFLVI